MTYLLQLKNDVESVKSLLENGVDVNARNDDGVTALMLAVRYGYEKIAKLLLEKNADVNAQDQDGNTALDLASDLEIRKMLEKA